MTARRCPELNVLRNDICAGIVGQHHAVEATRNGIVTFGNFKLLAERGYS